MNNLEEYVNQTAQLINLPIPPEYYQGVIANLERIVAIASLINNFPLPDNIEIAPIFNPDPTANNWKGES